LFVINTSFNILF